MKSALPVRGWIKLNCYNFNSIPGGCTCCIEQTLETDHSTGTEAEVEEESTARGHQHGATCDTTHTHTCVLFSLWGPLSELLMLHLNLILTWTSVTKRKIKKTNKNCSFCKTTKRSFISDAEIENDILFPPNSKHQYKNV